MSRTHIPTGIARYVVTALSAAVVASLGFWLGWKSLLSLFGLDKWYTKFSITSLVAVGLVILILPHVARRFVVESWLHLNLYVALCAHRTLLILGFMGRHRRTFASLLLLTVFVMFPITRCAIQRYDQADQLALFLKDTAQFINEEAIEARDNERVSDLAARFRALPNEATREYPHLSTVMDALHDLFDLDFDEHREHDYPQHYEMVIVDTIAHLPAISVHAVALDLQLAGILKAKLHLTLSNQGKNFHHVRSAYVILERLKSTGRTDPNGPHIRTAAYADASMRNLWAAALTMCASDYGDYEAWRKALGLPYFTPAELIDSAKSIHDYAFMSGSLFDKSRAANNRVDLELRQLWRVAEDEYRRQTTNVSTAKSQPADLEGIESTIHEYLADLASNLQANPNKTHFLTYAQADHLLARIYARRSIVTQGEPSKKWTAKATKHLESCVLMLEMSLVTGGSWPPDRDAPEEHQLVDLRATREQLARTFDGGTAVVEVYERQQKVFRKTLERRGVSDDKSEGNKLSKTDDDDGDP